ncbi:MAG: DUF1329 domain-containing protein [Georgfuchsia sp.]
MAGNKEGTIPAYTGEAIKVPASYKPESKGILVDPFADEKPLFSINAQNMAQYADKLSDGLKTLMKKYPTFRIDVYPTHRTAHYPKFVIDNTIANATRCKEVGPEPVNCVAGLPFPIPKTATQVMWNHQLAFEGASFAGRGGSYFVDSSGKMVAMGVNDYWWEFPYYAATNTGNTKIHQRTRYDYQEPARSSGEKILLHYKIDNSPVTVWQYLPGQRRVKLSPDLNYDTPNPQSGGICTMDELYLFYGPTDRYDWKIVGKKEMYIPYNNFQVYEPQCSAEASFTANHVNPSCVRYELHRTWVIEAKLKAGKRNIYGKRMIYLDEDTYNAGLADNYDNAGKLYREVLQYGIPQYQDASLGMSGMVFGNYDMQTGTYLVSNYPSSTIKGRMAFPEKIQDSFLQPGALAGSGIR